MSTAQRAKIVDVKTIDLLARAGVSSIVVNATAVAYSDTFQLQEGRVYAFDYQMAVGATVDVKFELEQSNVELTDAQESAANTSYVVPEDAAALDASLVDKLRHIKAYAPAATRFARFKVTGQGANSADTAVSRLVVSHIKG